MPGSIRINPPGRAREVHPLLYGVATLFVLYFLRGPIETLLF